MFLARHSFPISYRHIKWSSPKGKNACFIRNTLRIYEPAPVFVCVPYLTAANVPAVMHTTYSYMIPDISIVYHYSGTVIRVHSKRSRSRVCVCVCHSLSSRVQRVHFFLSYQHKWLLLSGNRFFSCWQFYKQLDRRRSIRRYQPIRN